jgi:formylmethanofuran dehydrogenase subunit E
MHPLSEQEKDWLDKNNEAVIICYECHELFTAERNNAENEAV